MNRNSTASQKLLPNVPRERGDEPWDTPAWRYEAENVPRERGDEPYAAIRAGIQLVNVPRERGDEPTPINEFWY